MSELSEDEKALLATTDVNEADATEKRPRRRRPEHGAERQEEVAAPAPSPARGPYTPVQYDDDGWGDLPVQMRG